MFLGEDGPATEMSVGVTEAVMGFGSALRKRFLLTTLVLAVAALIVVKSPSRVESSESSVGSSPEMIDPGAGWERGFRHLAVGP